MQIYCIILKQSSSPLSSGYLQTLNCVLQHFNCGRTSSERNGLLDPFPNLMVFSIWPNKKRTNIVRITLKQPSSLCTITNFSIPIANQNRIIISYPSYRGLGVFSHTHNHLYEIKVSLPRGWLMII